MKPDRRDPAINRALRAFNLPPLLTTRADDAPEQEDAEPMSRPKAAAIITFYTIAYAFGFVLLAAMAWRGHWDHLGRLPLKSVTPVVSQTLTQTWTRIGGVFRNTTVSACR